MPDCPQGVESNAALAEDLDAPAGRKEGAVLGVGTHWVSARMSAEPEALLFSPSAVVGAVQEAISRDDEIEASEHEVLNSAPAAVIEAVQEAVAAYSAGKIEAPEPEALTSAPAPDTQVDQQAANTDLISQIETLRRDLAAARADDDAEAERGMPLPQFLRDPLMETAGGPAQTSWEQSQTQDLQQNPSKTPAVHPRHYGAIAGWSMFALGAVLLIAGILHFGSQNVSHSQRLAEPSRAESSPQPRLNFVGADTCADKPCEPLLNIVSQAMADVPTQAAEVAGPGIVYTTGTPAVGGDAYPMLDPVDTVTIRGLPPGVSLSVGQRISATDWAVALGDVRDVDIVVPSGQTDPIHAKVDLKMRDGRDITLFGLNIQYDPPAAIATKVEAEAGNSEPAADKQAANPAPARAAKAKRTKVVKQQGAAAAKTKAAAAPRGLIQAPPASASAAPAPPPVKLAQPPAAKSTPAPDSAPVASFAGKPDQPPGFEVLMNLGGGFALQQP